MKKKDVSAHVYITNSKIQVLMGSCVKNKLQVVNCYEEPLEEGCILNGIIMNNYSLQNTLTEMWQKYNLPAKGVTLVVNGSSINRKASESSADRSEKCARFYSRGTAGY